MSNTRCDLCNHTHKQGEYCGGLDAAGDVCDCTGRAIRASQDGQKYWSESDVREMVAKAVESEAIYFETYNQGGLIIRKSYVIKMLRCHAADIRSGKEPL